MDIVLPYLYYMTSCQITFPLTLMILVVNEENMTTDNTVGQNHASCVVSTSCHAPARNMKCKTVL